MCGIAGKINFDPARPVDARQITVMSDSIRHRGPDDDGVWTSANVGLGHRRLSIIDLSASGRNPMCNEDGTIWIVYNGEVYNFQELRPGLEAKGHTFRSRTDTEVILHLYEEYGTECVQHLRGMFAFGLWDARRQMLMLARDRLGVKPLYYAETSGGLLFGSEIKALLSSGDIDPAPDPVALHQFLVLQCIPSPRTAFANIRKLPPASVLTWQSGQGLRIRTYWHVPQGAETPRRDKKELSEELRALVQEATRLRLIADVPVGLFLSGGIDSACVLAAARRENAGRIETFSVTFGDKSFDESNFARLLARHFATEHHEFRVTADVSDVLPRMASLFDEPFADVAAIPTYYLSKLTREHVKVALSGDGGDENLGGYQRYLALKVLTSAARVPGSSLLVKLRSWLPYSSGERSRFRYGRELLGLVDRSPRDQYKAMLLGMFSEEQWSALYSDEFRNTLGEAGTDFLDGWDEQQTSDVLTRAMAADIKRYIPECLNVKVDICSMACNLEVRSPFLDHKLVEFCAGIPTPLKIHGFTQKHILKQAFKNELPPEILRRGKSGFGMALANWFRHEWKDLVRDTLLHPQAGVRPLLDVAKVETMIDEHIAGRHNWHIQLWRLLVLENWMQTHLHSAHGVATFPVQEPVQAD